MNAPMRTPLSAPLLRSVLYPPVTPSTLFFEGETCVVLKSGSVFAEGVLTKDRVFHDKWKGRFLITFADASSAHIRPRNLIPCLAGTRAAGATCIHVVTETTDYYRRMAKACVQTSDLPELGGTLPSRVTQAVPLQRSGLRFSNSVD